jgi:hypothetical protein
VKGMPEGRYTVHVDGQYDKLRSCENLSQSWNFSDGGFSGSVLSNLLSVFGPEWGVSDRQYRLDRQNLRNVSRLKLVKYRKRRRAGVIQW